MTSKSFLAQSAVLCLFVVCMTTSVRGAEDFFSGPQIGEPLAKFESRAVLNWDQSDSFDLVAQANDRPVLIVFVHQLTRPAIACVRTVVNYAKQRSKDGLVCGVVFLAADPTEAEAMIRRASHALPQGVPIGISIDGVEGPGTYGLNRNAQLTILLGKESKVIANFALIQPSVQVDAVKIGASIAKLFGDTAEPTLEQMDPTLSKPNAMRDGGANNGVDDGEFRALVSPLIQRTASPEQVASAAKTIEERASKNPALKKRLGETAKRIIDAGKLDNYGTPAAQQVIRSWLP